MTPNDPHPFAVDQLGDALIVADAVTKPAVTPWLAEAGRRGLKTQTGKEMALAQVSIQLHYLRFRPTPSDTQSDRRVAEGLAE
jgi:shikimate dehydrogenase